VIQLWPDSASVVNTSSNPSVVADASCLLVLFSGFGAPPTDDICIAATPGAPMWDRLAVNRCLLLSSQYYLLLYLLLWLADALIALILLVNGVVHKSKRHSISRCSTTRPPLWHPQMARELSNSRVKSRTALQMYGFCTSDSKASVCRWYQGDAGAADTLFAACPR
jgi:hypothetical protein